MTMTFQVFRSIDVTVALCRLAMVFVALQWLLAGQWLECIVGAGTLILSILPSRCIDDALLRECATVVCCLLMSAHLVLGMGMGMYEHSAIYDKSMHFLGSAAIAGLLWLGLQRYCNKRHLHVSTGVAVVVVTGGTLAAGTGWELFEYAVDQTGWFNAQRGLDDTMLDIVANTAGALFAAVGLGTWQRVKPPIRAPHPFTETA